MNTHKELIEEKVVNSQCDAGDVVTGWVIQSDEVRKILQDTIDTVLEGERKRVFQALPEEMIVHEYMSEENTPARKGWNDYRMAVIKALTPLNKEE